MINTCSNVPLVLENEKNILHVHEDSVAFNFCSVITVEDYQKVYDFLVRFFARAAPIIVEYPFKLGAVTFRDKDVFVGETSVSKDINLMKEVLEALMEHARKIAEVKRDN